jgi:hypothetical protein
MVEDDCGDWIDINDAQSDVEWLIALIRKYRIKGSDEEYEHFDEICERWEV